MNLQIRKATDKDLPLYLDFLTYRDWCYSSLDNVWVALENDTPIGFARAEFFRDNQLATIAGVVIFEHARGSGIGLKICQAIIDHFKDISDWYLAGHDWVENYYGRMGFKAIDQRIPELVRPLIPKQVFMHYQN